MAHAFAEMFTPIPMAADDVRENAPIRYRLGEIEMCVPLFSMYRFKAFDRACRLLPYIIIDDQAIPFHKIMNLEGESGKLASTIRHTLQFWRNAGTLPGDIDDLAALVVLVSDPADPEHALRVLKSWIANTGCVIPVPDDARDLVNLRVAVHRWLQHTASMDDLALILDQIRSVNLTFKKKLLGVQVVKTKERDSTSPQKKLLSGLWKRSSENQQNGQ